MTTVDRRAHTFNWSPIIQAAALLITIVGLAIAGERRVSIVEQRLINLEQVVIELKVMNERWLNQREAQIEINAKTLITLDSLCKAMDSHVKQTRIPRP